MHILISNDDGISAGGIRALAHALHRAGHKVTVSAPDRERSASGHALTMLDPLYAERVSGFDEGVSAWAVSGTPVDCVRLGLLSLAEGEVDLVVSGINHGANLGSDTIYSGTVAAAMEALILGYPSLAVSLGSRGRLEFLEGAAALTCRVVSYLEKKGPDAKLLYNLNVPALPEDEIKGLRAAGLHHKKYVGGYERLTSPYGRDHYWLNSFSQDREDEPGSDAQLLREGWATLTPLSWSLMERDALDRLMEEDFGDGTV